MPYFLHNKDSLSVEGGGQNIYIILYQFASILIIYYMYVLLYCSQIL